MIITYTILWGGFLIMIRVSYTCSIYKGPYMRVQASGYGADSGWCELQRKIEIVL